jgi:hypothetical protein
VNRALPLDDVRHRRRLLIDFKHCLLWFWLWLNPQSPQKIRP